MVMKYQSITGLQQNWMNTGPVEANRFDRS